MDNRSFADVDGRKCLTAIKCFAKDRQPVLYFSIGGGMAKVSHYCQIRPADAGQLADWIFDIHSGGWTVDQGPRVPEPEPVLTPAEVQERTDRERNLLLYVLNCLAWKLPKEYGSAWLVGELASVGVNVEWVEGQERFRLKEIEGRQSC